MPSVQQEYQDAMATADIIARRLERNVTKLRETIERIHREAESAKPKAVLGYCRTALIQMQGLMVNIHTPDLSKWRQEHAAAEKARHDQQEVLTRKLARAKELLLDAGWDKEALEVDLKANAPQGRQLAQRSYRERAARKRVGGDNR